MQAETLAARFGFGSVGGVWPDPSAYAAPLREAPDAFPRAATATALSLGEAYTQARRARTQKAQGAAEALREAARALTLAARDAARASIARAVDAGRAGGAADFRERLVWFWADHFAVAARRPRDRLLPASFVDDAIRPNVAGPFAALLRAATLHPAMLHFLDQSSSIGPGSPAGQRRGAGLNENLARELLELHTMGARSGYTQTDVRELAALLTGVTVDPSGGMVFEPRRAEPGAETVLGRSYGGGRARIDDVLAVLDDLAARPETNGHIARKLAVHFVADDPDPALVARLAAAWADTGGDLSAVAAALAADPAAQAAPRTKVRRPLELVVAGLRALGLDGADVMALPPRVLIRHVLAPMAAMGQPWLAPGGPDGWPEEAAAWITPQRLAARIDWAMTAPAAMLRDLPDPRTLAERALGRDSAGVLARAVAGAEQRAEGVGLVLAAPAFNRR